MDIYEKYSINKFLDEDSITAEEHAFMLGYLS